MKDRYKLIDWERLPIQLKYSGKKGNLRYKVKLRKVVARELGIRQDQALARMALECFMHRRLEPYEQACHVNGDAMDNSITNLKAQCYINNAIDEIDVGRKLTSLENLLHARERLTIMIDNYETTD